MPVEDILELREKTIKTKKNPYVKQKEHFAEQNQQNQARQKYEEQKKEKDKKEISGHFNKLGSTFNNVNSVLKVIGDKEKIIATSVGLAAAGLVALIGYLKGLETGEGIFGGSGGTSRSGRSSGKTSPEGIRYIKNHESFQPKAYKIKGEKYWTIGYGHSGPDVHEGDTITREEAEKLFEKDLQRFENAVNNGVKVPISQNMFDALVDFAYNVGTGAFAKSTLLKKLNAGDYKGAADEFDKWNKGSSGEVLGGLVERNKWRKERFLTDVGADNTLLGPEVNPIKTPEVSQQGGKVGNIGLNGGVKINDSMKEYLTDVSGNGGQFTVTSSMDGSHAGTAANPRSHYSGNKIDVSVAGLTDDQIINYLLMPMIKDPRTKEIGLENMGNQGDRIVKRLEGKHPGIKLWAWYNKDATGPHIDVLIDPNKKPTPKANLNQQNQNADKGNQNNKNLQKTPEAPKQQPQSTSKPAAQPTKVQQPANSQQKQPQRIDIGKANPYNANAKQKQNATNKKK